MRTRTAIVGAVVATLVLVNIGYAIAHVVYERNYVWEDGMGKCLSDYSEVSHGNNGGGYTKVVIDTSRKTSIPPLSWDCSRAWDRPPGYLAAVNLLYVYTSSGWALCRQTATAYNTTSTSHLEQERYWSTPCGNGNYGNEGGGWLNLNGSWQGGYEWSGYHLLPPS